MDRIASYLRFGTSPKRRAATDGWNGLVEICRIIDTGIPRLWAMIS